MYYAYRKTPVESCSEQLFNLFSSHLDNSWMQTYSQMESAAKKIRNGVPPHIAIEEDWIKEFDLEVVLASLKSVKHQLDNSPF